MNLSASVDEVIPLMPKNGDDDCSDGGTKLEDYDYDSQTNEGADGAVCGILPSELNFSDTSGTQFL